MKKGSQQMMNTPGGEGGSQGCLGAGEGLGGEAVPGGAEGEDLDRMLQAPPRHQGCKSSAGGAAVLDAGPASDPSLQSPPLPQPRFPACAVSITIPTS